MATLTLVAAPPPVWADQVRDAQWHLDYLKITQAHAITRGAGVTVAVLDSGVDAQHPDLKGAILPGANLTILKEGSPVGWTDEDGHGTAMSGLIAAQGKAGSGALGIAPEAKVLPIRLQTDRTTPVSGFEEALKIATARGAKVVNMSFGSPTFDSINADAVAAAQAADLVLVAASGNAPDDKTIGYPASYPGVITVGAVDRKGNHADYSLSGEQIMLTAPGTDITSTDIKRNNASGYSAGPGTSNSAAIVSGAVALVRAKYPQLTAAQVVERITSTATDKGPKGRDPEYGYGVIDVMAALTAPLEEAPAPATAAPVPPGSGADAPSDKDGLPTAALAAIGGGALLLVGTLAVLVVLIRRRRIAT
ncbi:S8 family serine peptidase [Actinoplanes sp. NPDC051859]|uniref:S8 family serine peptidase n=1 Tax=Actinoplanes sp. NPDC051859 TaxID=3363909 RepID=UPI00378C6927